MGRCWRPRSIWRCTRAKTEPGIGTPNLNASRSCGTSPRCSQTRGEPLQREWQSPDHASVRPSSNARNSPSARTTESIRSPRSTPGLGTPVWRVQASRSFGGTILGTLGQAGTPLYVLQELGGWESVEMVRRYAHLSTAHLVGYVDRLSGLKLVGKEDVATFQAQSHQ